MALLPLVPLLPCAPRAVAGLAICAALASAPAWAQYKVVATDGSVTYTDRPPVADRAASITALGRSGATTALSVVETPLPPELQRAQRRYPVTLYTGADCPHCEAARRFLQGRGIPYAERRAESDDDVLALERITGARTVPALAVGGQALRGYFEADWSAYLDAAGYPREPRLPRGWQPPAPQPITERSAAAPAAAPVRPNAGTEPPAAAAEPPPPSGGVRF